MKHGGFITILNPSNSHCNGATRMTWFKGQAADFYVSGKQKLFPRLNKYLDNTGDYFGK
jgi:hypothetical protein